MAALALPALALSSLAYLDARTDLSRDLRLIAAIVKARIALKRSLSNDKCSIWYEFEQAYESRGDAECYQCEGVSLSWKQVFEESNRIARYFLALGLKRGDTIALFMPNKLAFPVIFIACLSIDVIPALINYNLVSTALSHCISIASPKFILYDSSISSPIADVAGELGVKMPDLAFVRWRDEWDSAVKGEKGEEAGAKVEGETELTPVVRRQYSGDKLPDSHRKGVSWTSPICLIYTSGTTGLPKAALTLHGRASTAMRVWTSINGFDKNSRIYTPMPLYHATALALAVLVSWHSQSTVIIGKKFSASRFWTDVRESKATAIQYVGEVLRYLLSQPPSPLDTSHSVRLAYGNGLRPDVWSRFRHRFNIPSISEFYASSEGNGSLLNFNGNDYGAGAVGREGTLLGLIQREKQVVVKVDEITEEPERAGPDGLCVRAGDGEKGELMMVIEDGSGHQSFAGYYKNDAGTEKKIVRDVIRKGDKFFRTGDLLYRTSSGLWYFADRLGDSYRWKSENVSTTEVAEKLGAFEGLSEVNVYGVLVPGNDGRAGCAAIPRHVASQLDFDALAKHVQAVLPKYAQPVFLRVVPHFETTGTAKLQKVLLRTQGVDPAVVPSSDDLYWLNPETGRYERFRKGEWEGVARRVGGGGGGGGLGGKGVGAKL